MAFLKKFPNDDACWRHLEKVRWSHGPVCAKCGRVGPTMACGRKHYHECKACNAKFTVAFGTPLEGRPVGVAEAGKVRKLGVRPSTLQR